LYFENECLLLHPPASIKNFNMKLL